MLYLILLLPLAMAALSLIRNDRARTVILAVGQALLLALLIAGSFADLLKNPESLTGAYLSGKERIEVPAIQGGHDRVTEVREDVAEVEGESAAGLEEIERKSNE